MSKLGRQEGALGISKTRSSPTRITPIPLEWLDPDCWRLPSGKALAEFALQAGFLAPLMLGVPKAGRKRPAPAPASDRLESQLKPREATDGDRKMGRETARPMPGGGKRA